MAALVCPACGNNMARSKCDVSGLEIDSCYICQGIWFDRDELRRFFSSEVLSRKFTLNQFKVKVKEETLLPERKCPRCEGELLEEIQLNDLSVDECKSCRGIWLDSGEINRLLEMHEEKELKGRHETVKQIKRGKFDQTAIGQVGRLVGMVFTEFFGKK